MAFGVIVLASELSMFTSWTHPHAITPKLALLEWDMTVVHCLSLYLQPVLYLFRLSRN